MNFTLSTPPQCIWCLAGRQTHLAHKPRVRYACGTWLDRASDWHDSSAWHRSETCQRRAIRERAGK